MLLSWWDGESRVRRITGRIIDIRSDTSSLPTEEMREAMKKAEVGNDGYGDDPTVNRLQDLAAAKIGKEAALFVPSGTMGNLVALLTHTQRGHEIIAEDQAHIVTNERGYACVAGLEVRRIRGHKGAMGPHEVEDAIITSRSLKIDLICLENTHMNAGGAVVPPDNISQVCDVAHKHGIPTHLDGARIFNASTALGIPADRVVKHVDSIMFCLSKGLCAPVGSMLAGSRDFIAKAKQMRRVVGGQMRQAGVVAAAGILALEKMVDRLNEDHENARFLAEGLSSIEGIELDLDDVQTNLVFFDVGGLGMDAKAFASKLLDEWNIKIDAREKSLVRALTYKDITRQDVEYVVNAIREASAR